MQIVLLHLHSADSTIASARCRWYYCTCAMWMVLCAMQVILLHLQCTDGTLCYIGGITTIEFNIDSLTISR